MTDSLGHRFTFTEAATACQVSKSTIIRKHRSGAFPNAEQGQSGTWHVPLADLLAAGFSVNGTEADSPSERGQTSVTDSTIEPTVTVSVERLIHLERQAAKSEMLERQVQTLTTVIERLALPPAPEKPAAEEPAPEQPAAQVVDIREPEAATRRRWFRRR